jgi:hypothetical protein
MIKTGLGEEKRETRIVELLLENEINQITHIIRELN